ncbi:MAG: choline dehydrogenase [Paracoccus sp. (in: a-proteobacteria)]|uniref:choline dehydrogenase n=1 Tax=unclassified Paracoccus (in: a-proteobacteria) TaxID=2688777 RepID=UPI000C530122|nr:MULTISPECIES: choline dehydrogenase [unclassified Paracoccus (in: a-proteobacteria)]MAN57548.1 choline dehydrogenase [Paracoccus sp. (in: a-proteobacteria)]|tara:strand:+ start:6206 stop:7807 length:1602 start_codon:yes stop_codon:yes gene_type:complete
MSQPDYVIVGAGSAGCALAYRLTEAGRTVALIEFGGSDFGIFIQMPGALSYPMNMPRYDWGFSSAPEDHLGGRRLATPRGKVLGGSSSINGMVFVRGNRKDFDHWADQGATGWGYADVLPYFKRMENWHGGDSPLRGTDGPLHVTRGKRRNPLFNAFIEAGQQAGWPYTPDYNGENQEGFGPMEATIWRGRRWSAANAYLRPALKSGKLRVIRALARRVIFVGNRATGVEIQRKGRIETVGAGREVILSASSINTPKLLMLSGIGPADHLREHEIRVRADRPGVGANLQDHLEIYMQYKALKPVSLYTYYNLLGKSRVGIEWLLQKTGLGASNQFESCGFICSGEGVDYPDIQYHFLPLAVRYDGKAAASGHGFQAHVGPMRSKSRGSVRLDSSDPEKPPVIHFNYMSHPDDWKEFRACVRLTRRIFDQPAFKEYRGDEIQPGGEVVTDAQIDAFIREHAESAYHPCGTARIGQPGDPEAVVDPELRVIGVEGLRVADSSVFPRITNGNLNAPSIMTGEKAADHILGRTMLRA